MHPLRAIPAIVIFVTAIFYSSKVLGTMRLNEVMTLVEQKKTGVAALSDAQKKELESWINDKFVLKTIAATPTTAAQQIYLQQNMQSGAQLMFSDGSIYEVAPTDRSKTVFWLTPIAISIEPSGDPNYPAKITNTLTNVSVSAKMVRAPQAQMNPQQ
ncbi:MAG TPA: hypothetical protein VMR37_04310 [Rhabdochlamydiaceae bacterium]|jgi:hypothetical protein|nr:hypothetical protein [Rhabdochlamydiaceae bacterium]